MAALKEKEGARGKLADSLRGDRLTVWEETVQKFRSLQALGIGTKPVDLVL